jgi:ATP-dependent RNA helicase DDX55/SPB4
MPELKDKLGKLNFQPAGPEIDIHAIKFKDKTREKARQKRLATELAAGGKNAKLIKAEQRAAAKLQHQKDRRAAELRKGRNPDKKRGKQAQIFDEWEELGKEERLHKKLKQGKITQEQYDALLYSIDGKVEEEDSDSS